jgi:two-component system sensor histidine kinase/response regulator
MPPRILIIDDDKHVRLVLAKYIRRLGYDVIEVGSGPEALQVISNPTSGNIDLVLSDIFMPEMSGVDVLKAVHDIDPDLPVAMITGAATLDTSIAALNAGAYAYLTKPVQNEQVRDVLDRGLRKYQETRKQKSLQQELMQRYGELEKHLEELQERQQQMPQSDDENDLLAELIRGLRHELGNATTAIKLNLSVLEEGVTNPTSFSEHLRDLQTSTDHLVHLLSKLREYPKGDMVTDLVDLRQLVVAMEDVVNDRIGSDKVQVTCTIPEYDIPIIGAEIELSRAFKHILQNAIEANDQTGALAIHLDAAIVNDMASVTISDHGPGFPPVMLDQPFSPGYTTKLNGGTLRGLGMGLFIARAIIEQHNGRIWIENRSDGGASVHVELPLAAGNTST